MGIPGYTKWLKLRFPGCFHPVHRNQPLAAQLPLPIAGRVRPFDHVHFDLAARLYMVSGRANDTSHLLKLLLGDLHAVVRWAAPKRSVTLAIDGVPPAAKLWTQRIRRFDPKRGNDSGRKRRGIDTLGFTIGTLLMRQVGMALHFCAVQALQAKQFAKTVFYVSGPEVYGEGEHKLHVRVLSLLREKPAETHLIIGNDADLIVQACAAAAVVEQSQAPRPVRSRLLDPHAGPSSSCDQISLLLTYRGSNQLLLPVAQLASAVLADLPAPASTTASAPRTLLDLALLSLLMGSDYLPRPSGLRLASSYPAYLALKQEQPAAYLVHPYSVGDDGDLLSCGFRLDHAALARMIELVLEGGFDPSRYFDEIFLHFQ